ncbi:MAG: hypothetical protein ACMUIM_00310 [bacterium]
MSLPYEKPVLVPFRFDQTQVGRGKCATGSGDSGNCQPGTAPAGKCLSGTDDLVIPKKCEPGAVASNKCTAGGVN